MIRVNDGKVRAGDWVCFQSTAPNGFVSGAHQVSSVLGDKIMFKSRDGTMRDKTIHAVVLICQTEMEGNHAYEMGLRMSKRHIKEIEDMNARHATERLQLMKGVVYTSSAPLPRAA
jgi:hypothetical protein